jgi:hypothetical protein
VLVHRSLALARIALPSLRLERAEGLKSAIGFTIVPLGAVTISDDVAAIGLVGFPPHPNIPRLEPFRAA